MQNQLVRSSIETEVIARLVVQMEAAKWQISDSEDVSQDFETWEWEGGATVNTVN